MESCCQEKGSIIDIASASALTKTYETSAGTASFIKDDPPRRLYMLR